MGLDVCKNCKPFIFKRFSVKPNLTIIFHLFVSRGTGHDLSIRYA